MAEEPVLRRSTLYVETLSLWPQDIFLPERDLPAPRGKQLDLVAYTPGLLRNHLYDIKHQVEAAIKRVEEEIEKGTG